MSLGKSVFVSSLILTLCACSGDKAPATAPITPPAKVFTVGGEDTMLYHKLPGTVRASQQVNLAFQVPGRLVEFPVTEGQRVNSGDLLAKLDDRDYRSTVDAAIAEASKNASNLKRAKELIVKNFISQSELDRLQAAYNVSSARLDQAEKALQDSQLVAPFNGTVAKTFVDNFQEVQAKQAILSLQNKQDLEVVVALSESLVARRKEGKALTLTASFAALPDQPFELYLKEFSTEADPQTQTFEVVLGVKSTGNAKILPGMTADVTISRKRSQEEMSTLIIPLVALVKGPEGASVWVVDASNKVSQQAVTTGPLYGSEEIEITAGLQPGSRIVTAGLSKLTQGMTIKPIAEVKY